jgi:hypothetical protein
LRKPQAVIPEANLKSNITSETASQNFHSMYSDGTLVPKGTQPPRIGTPIPSPEATGAHTQLRWDTGRGRIYQAREFDVNGYPVKDIDFTNPTFGNGTPRPGHYGPPHVHPWEINDLKVGPKSGFKRIQENIPFEQ